MVAFGVPQSKCERHLFPPSSSWNKNILPHGHNSTGYSLPSWSASLTGSCLLLCLKEPFPGPCVLGGSFPYLGDKEKDPNGWP